MWRHQSSYGFAGALCISLTGIYNSVPKNFKGGGAMRFTHFYSWPKSQPLGVWGGVLIGSNFITCRQLRLVSGGIDLAIFGRNCWLSLAKYSDKRQGTLPPLQNGGMNEWMNEGRNEWICSDSKCILKPTRSRLSLTHHANKSSRWAE